MVTRQLEAGNGNENKVFGTSLARVNAGLVHARVNQLEFDCGAPPVVID